MQGLDLKDRKILYELDANARQSDSAIAKKTGLSRDSVRYRIEKMQKQGYIGYFMTLLNSMKLGYDWYRTFFEFQNLTVQKEEEMIKWIGKHASWISRVEGQWDLNTGIFCKNIYEYQNIMNEFLLKYSNHINRYAISIVTREWSYQKEYLLGKKRKSTRPILMGFDKDRETVQIDSIDYSILKVLLRNARDKTIDIARKLGTTEMVIRYRIKKLEQQGIIIGYKPFLNVKKLGYTYFKLHVQLRNLTKEKKRTIFEYMHQHPNTVHTTELVGGADLECEFQVLNNEEFYEEIRQLRLRFGDIIRNYEFMQYTDEYKFTYLPEMQF